MSNSNVCNSQSYCRMCLTDEMVTLKSIFDETLEECALPQKILQYFGIEISKADKFSTAVCSQCVAKVIGFDVYKDQCTNNQFTLKNLPIGSDESFNGICETSFHVKEEPMGDDDTSTNAILGDILIELVHAKNEPSDQTDGPMEEEYNELPPVLSPHLPDPKLMLNGVSGCPAQQENTNSPVVLEPQIFEDPSELKMQNPARSELLPISATTISDEPLSKMELSYIEKCKAMVNMHQTLLCACHNIPHQNVRGLMSHLRALRTWFPVFTCYNCMITFTDRSTFGRHIVRCPRQSLEAITRLGNTITRSNDKTRLYQNFKCTVCKFVFSFHEDFCKHIDEKHSPLAFPFHCQCLRIFESIDDYKDHVHVSCLVDFYCDICFIATKTTDDFQRHARDVHDNSEGFILLQDVGFRMKKPIMGVVEEMLENCVKLNEKGERRTSVRTSIAEQAKKHAEQAILNGTEHSSKLLKKNSCEYCSAEFSRSVTLEKHVRQNHKEFSQKEDEDDYVRTSIIDQGKNHGSSICGECGKSFQVQSELEQHRSVHFNMDMNRKFNTIPYERTSISPKSDGKKFEDTDRPIENITSEASVVSSSSDKIKQKCDLCDKKFATCSGLGKHRKRIHPERNTLLSKSFSKFNNRGKRHAFNNEETNTEINKIGKRNNSLTGEESYHKCKGCYRIFSTEQNMKNHMKSHEMNANTSARVIQKSNCNNDQELPETIEAVAKHKETYSVGANLSNQKQAHIFCIYCEISFYSKVSLMKHMNEEHDEAGKPKTTTPDAETEENVPCTICAKNFQTTAALASHIGWHKRGQNEANTKLMRQDKLPVKLAHSANIMQKPSDEPKFQCASCAAELPNDIALQVHALEMHRNDSAIMLIPRCNTCNKDFTTQDEYETHTRLHEFLESKKLHEQNILPQQQEECQVVPIKTPEQMEVAAQPEPDGTKNSPKLAKDFSCKYCSSVFGRPNTLEKHVRQNHKELVETKFKCKQCNRIFEKKSSLTIHLKVHEKQRVVKGPASKTLVSCSVCSMIFDTPKDFKAHIVSAHPF